MDTPKPVRVKDNDVFFFLHIPKTAGTSFYSMLVSNFFPNNSLIVDDHVASSLFGRYYPDRLSRYKFFRQHADYSFSRFLPRKPIFLTFLRDPISRVISLYNHLMKSPDPVQKKNLEELSDLSLLSFVDDMKKRGINNQQTKSIVGKHANIDVFTKNDLLEIAKFRLNEFAFTGIQEHYSDSMKLLSYLFSWPEIKILNINKSTKTISVEDLSAKEKKRIEEDNLLDIKLYNYELKRFREKIRKIDGTT